MPATETRTITSPRPVKAWDRKTQQWVLVETVTQIKVTPVKQ